MKSDTTHPTTVKRPPTPKILIVDDEIDVLRSTQMLLERLGYNTLVLPETNHLMEVVASERPDLILQDLTMPGIRMEEIFDRLRTQGNPPVVLFSASDELADRAAALDAGGFLHKPFSEGELRQIVESLVGPAVRAPEAPPTPPTGRHFEPVNKPELVAYFHENRNLLTALNNYAQFLLSSPTVREPEREAVEEINRLLLEIERRNNEFRAKMLGDEA